MIENLRRVLNLLVFLSPALTLIVWGSYTIVNLCLILIGIFVLVRRSMFEVDGLAISGGLRLAATLLAYSALGIALLTYHHDAFKLYGQYLIFLLMPLAYWAIVGIGVNQNFLWLGAATGGILSAIDSGYQIIALHVDRAGGYMDSIQYGNIGVVLATASMVGALRCIKSRERKYSMLIVLVLGVIGGALTSFFSGSKGGWLSLVIAVVFIDRLARPYWSVAKRQMAIAAILTVFVLIAALPQSPVHKRLQHAWQDYSMWRDSGSTEGGSVGPRLELWRFGLRVAAEKPLLGFGYDGLMKRKSEAVAAGEFNDGIDAQPGLHNHFLHNYISYGIFGLVQLAILLLLPFRVFARQWRKDNPDSEALAVMGILLILTHIEFGMSNGLFELNAVRQIFLFWLVVLTAMLHRSSVLPPVEARAN